MAIGSTSKSYGRAASNTASDRTLVDIWAITASNPDRAECVIETVFYKEGPTPTTNELEYGDASTALNIDDTPSGVPFKKTYYVKPCISRQLCTGTNSAIHTLTVAVCGGETL